MVLKIIFVALVTQITRAVVQVVQPSNLVDKIAEIVTPLANGEKESEDFGVIHATMGNFGHITYGETIIARVFAPKLNEDGCQEFEKEHFGKAGQEAFFDKKRDMVVPVILVKRGACTFTHKVRNIEKAGASAALLVDNKIEMTERIVMADDGSGQSIHIPSFLLRQESGQVVKQFAQREEPVIVKISTDVHESSSGRASVALWISSPFEISSHQAQEFASFVGNGLDKHIDFNVMINSHSMSYLESKFKNSTCVSDGRYCVEGNKILRTPFWKRSESKQPTYTKGSEGPNGSALLGEDLRQKCLVQLLKDAKASNVAAQYFNYLSAFLKECENEIDEMTQCAEKVYVKINGLPDQEKVTACVENSFEKMGDTNSDNIVLKEDVQEKTSLGIFMHPSVTINNYTYRGNFGAKDVFKAICQTFRHKPEECKTSSDVDILMRTEGSQADSGIVQRAIASDTQAIKSKRRTIIVSLMVGAIILLALQCVCLAFLKKRQQNQGSAQMQVDIQESLATYQKLHQSESK